MTDTQLFELIRKILLGEREEANVGGRRNFVLGLATIAGVTLIGVVGVAGWNSRGQIPGAG